MSSAVVFGAGNIGRGFIGHLLYKSGFRTVFVDVDDALVELLNNRREYPLRIVSSLGENEETVSGISAVNGKDTEAVVSALVSAGIAVTAVGVGNLEKIADALASGILRRIEADSAPINILVCENMIGANLKLKQLIESRLPKAVRSRLEQAAGFVEVSVGRMVPAAVSNTGDALRLLVEPYDKLPYDASCWRGAPVSLYGGVPCECFDYYIKRKLFIHNLGHAAAAYFGFLKGWRYIHEAINDAAVAELAKAAMDEAGNALNKEFPQNTSLTLEHIDDLIFRFGNRLLADPVARVGADPLRKLGPNDRIVGAIRNCQYWETECPHILAAAAAALLYENGADESSLKMQRQIEGNGLEYFLERHCGIWPAKDDIYYPIKTAYISLRAAAGFGGRL